MTNSYGFGFDTKVVGSYDYSYVITYYVKKNNRWTSNGTKTQHRNGSGIADATAHLDDISAMLKGSYHYSFSDRIDTYATLGFGVSFYKMSFSPKEDGETDMFYEANYPLDKNSTSPSQPVFQYKDLDHVKWIEGSSHARLAMALFIGMRYYITDKWAINGEFGLTSASFKKDCNVYNLLSIGASYKF